MSAYGAERAFDYAKAGFADELETYDAIFVAVDKLPFSECLKRLKPGGTYLNVTAPLKSLPMLVASLSVSKGKIFTGETIPRDKEDLSILKDLLEAGRIKPVIDRTFPFERIADAHRYVDLGHKRGNVAVTIP
jgi:NADPH:quinone reductase-like Zn-dependent oxidoreductase